MLKNYFKTAFRNLSRNKVFSFINIAGLSIGLSCCMLIILYTKDEVTYDQFQQKKDQLYQLTCRIIRQKEAERKFALGAMTQGPSFKQEIPELLDYVRVKSNEEVVIRTGKGSFNEKISWADNNFFTIFTFPLQEGDSRKALSDLHSIVLTEEMAQKYFGTEHAIGKTLDLEFNKKFEPFTVSAIAKNAPQNSSIRFGMVLPYQYYQQLEPGNGWNWLSYSTFFLVRPGSDIKNIEAKMARVYQTDAKEEIEQDKKEGGDAPTLVWGIRPLLSIHLDTTFESDNDMNTSNPLYSYILTGIALFVLLIACINFINLTVAQSLKRSKEVGIRKVIGSDRKQLIFQFLGESFLLCAIAFFIAILLAQAILPVFNTLANKQLSLAYLFDVKLAAGLSVLFLITGLAAGCYPAFVLSGFNPATSLYNRMKLSRKNYLSRVLVVIQFALATFLIITTLCIYAQFNYLAHKDLGYNDKNLLVVTVGRGRDNALMQTFLSEFSKAPGVEIAAPVMEGEWITTARAGGKELNVKFDHIDEHFLSAFQIPLIEGRNFSAAYPSDSSHSVLVNEAFVKEVGWSGSAIGRNLDFLNGRPRKLTIVGVVRNYHFESLKEKIRPQVFTANPDLPFGKFVLRVNAGAIAQTLPALEKTYRALVPFHPFQYDFMEALNQKNYEDDARWKQIITYSAILTIFIACIGLFGLTMQNSETRVKEIGIRKVLGASATSIVQLISGHFIRLVLLANIIAFPLAWWAVTVWLRNFAYHITPGWWIFVLAAVLALTIAFLTVSAQAFRAAMSDPAKNLRSE
jgi:putative ABC transport system permease protein